MRTSLVVLIVFLLSGCSNLFAQPYHQLLKNDRHWIYTKMASEPDPAIHITVAFALSMQGDTLLQGHFYKKIYQRTLRLNDFSTAIYNPKQILNTSLYGLMREDTTARKVYWLPLQDTVSMCQPTEHLLYDFSLQEGDTLNACVLETISEPFLAYVPRIDSIRQETLLGQDTRAFYTQGVFINEGLLFDIPGRLLEGFGYELHGLINFGRKGPLVRFVSFCEGDSIDCEFLTAVKESPEMPQPVIMLSPNPTRNVVIVQMDPAFTMETELQVSLINSAGKVVRRINWNSMNELEVDVSNLPDGMYFLNVSGEGMSVVKKIVIAK